MTAKTITFAVQLGSGGSDIARSVAEKLNYRYYDWEVTLQAANEAGVSPEAITASEHAPSLIDRMMDRLLIAGDLAEDEGISRHKSETMASAIVALGSRQYREFVEGIVEQLGEAGKAVIVGHAGQVVLRESAGVLKVLVHGSTERRTERLASEEGLARKKALVAVRDSDRDRISFFKKTYNVDLLEARLYHLGLNTDVVSLNSAADLVVEAAKAISALMPDQSSGDPVA